MTTIRLTTFINAPMDRCFDLSRSIQLHLQSTSQTGEKAIAGKTDGLIEQGETVTWEAVHFGIRQRLTSTIVDMRRPDYFSDAMVEGAFKSIFHEHHFESHENGTLMTDVFVYETPYGLAGELFDKMILKNYMTSLLAKRNKTIKEAAESDQWKQILEL